MKWAFGVVVLAAACGSSPATVDPVDPVELGPATGWPSSVSVRSVPATFRTAIAEIAPGAGGTVWLLRGEVAQPSQLLPSPALEHYAADGPLLRRITFAPHALVSSFVVHPSGELSVFVMRDDDGDTQKYDLHIVRLSEDGDEGTDVGFTELPGPHENLFYDGSGGVQELPADVPFNLSWMSHVVALPDGDGLVVLAEWTYGFKLYRLSPSYEKEWGVQVMPANIGVVFQGYPSLLARDDDGSIYVGTPLFEEDAHIYGEHFGRAPLVPIGSYDTLVQRFDAAGAWAGVRLFGGPAIDHASAMTVHGGTVLLAGAARIVKHTDANRTMEWDVMLDRGKLDDAPHDYRTLDLSRDDFAWSLAEAPDGSLVLGGSTDYVQVDTNSQVEDGKGFFLTLGADLAPRPAVLLPGPRDVEVRALAPGRDGAILFAGTRDGPLTHTDPSMTNNDGVWGVLR